MGCRFIFVEFKNPDDAAFAIGVMNNHPFDSKHRFRVNRFTDIEHYANMDETYVEPEPEPYVQKVLQTLLPFDASIPRDTHTDFF